MSRKVSSSAPSSEYFRARATGSPWSRSCWKCVPLTTRPPAVSRQGMIRLSNMGTRLGRGLGIREAQEVLEQAQSGGPASFGMELHAHQTLAGDRADEGHAVRGLGGGDRGISRHDHVGVHEVEGLTLHPFQHRVWTDAFNGVPADMGQLLRRFHQLHRAGKDTQAGGAVLGAPVEEQLHPQADPKERDPVANGRNDGLVEAPLPQAGHCRCRGANPRKDDGLRVGQILGGRGNGARGAEARQGILHPAQVAAAVVDERDHFVLGIRSPSAGSTAHAWRSARARALKVASARWWSSRPEAITCRVTPPRSAKVSRKWGTRVAGSEPIMTPRNGTSTIAWPRPTQSRATVARLSSSGTVASPKRAMPDRSPSASASASPRTRP